jgi:hypothetical protein
MNKLENLIKSLEEDVNAPEGTSSLVEVAKELVLVQSVQEKIMTTLQGIVNNLNDLRQRAENSQVIMSSLLRTIADSRPLEPQQLRESHHLIVAEKVHKIFNSAVDSGIIERVDNIAEDSIVIVQEFDANGVEMHRASEFSMTNIDTDSQALFLNKKAGDRVAMFKDGQLLNTFVVQDVFKPLERIEKEFNAEIPPTETTEDTQKSPS